MGWYVHVEVSFSCCENEPVAALARKHAPNHLEDGPASDSERAARWFLDDLAGRTGENMGPKGGVSLWGMIGNYTHVDVFCERLRPFWKELLETPKCGPSSHAHIIVFEEQEQSEQAIAYEIKLADEERTDGELVITRHALPFCWNQY